MEKHMSLEITINVTINRRDREHGPAGIEIVDWQFDVRPPEGFRELSPLDRAAVWSTVRDEIDEFWFQAALESDPDAAWNLLMEDVDLD
jgi:hypothetical protein